MSTVDGRLDVVVSRDTLLAAIDRADGPKFEVTVESLADKIHVAFCEPRGWRGLAGEVHRRQHVEIAQAILDAKGVI